MAVVMRLISLILIVTALMLLGADAVTSLERGGDLTVRSLGTIWGLFNPASLNAAKSWVQNHAAFMAQGVYSSLALPGWAVTGVIGVILAFVFGRDRARIGASSRRCARVSLSEERRTLAQRQHSASGFVCPEPTAHRPCRNCWRCAPSRTVI